MPTDLRKLLSDPETRDTGLPLNLHQDRRRRPSATHVQPYQSRQKTPVSPVDLLCVPEVHDPVFGSIPEGKSDRFQTSGLATRGAPFIRPFDTTALDLQPAHYGNKYLSVLHPTTVDSDPTAFEIIKGYKDYQHEYQGNMDVTHYTGVFGN